MQYHLKFAYHDTVAWVSQYIDTCYYMDKMLVIVLLYSQYFDTL